MVEPKVVRASSIGRAFVVLGDRWTWLILRAAFLGVRRFGDWQAALGLSDPLLAARLRNLVDAGVLEKVPYSDHRNRSEYHLTEQGLQLWAPLVAIWTWETTWVPGRAAVAPRLIHESCGHPTKPVLQCGSCGRETDARGVTPQAGPGAGWDDAPRARHHRRTTQSGAASDDRLYEPQTMAIIGDRWSAAVLAACFAGIHRFSQFESELHIPPFVLTERLKTFAAHDVIRPVASATNRLHKEYRLSTKGLALFPVLMTLMGWADHWLAGASGPPVRVIHNLCGQDLNPRLACDHCHAVLTRRSLRFVDADGQPSVLTSRAGRG